MNELITFGLVTVCPTKTISFEASRLAYQENGRHVWDSFSNLQKLVFLWNQLFSLVQTLCVYMNAVFL